MIYLITTLIFNLAAAQTVTPKAPPKSGDPVKAYQLAREIKWTEARTEAENATKSDPQDAKAWFILGVSEERLENLDLAVKAYQKYVALADSTPASKAVQEKLPGLKTRAKTKAEKTYGRTSNGLFFEKSMSYSPSYVDEIGGENSTPFAIGINFGKVYWGYRQFTGNFTADLKVPDDSVPAVYSTVSGGGDFTSRQLFANINFSLIDPYTKWGNMQLALPFYSAFGTNYLKFNSTGKEYGNWTYDLGIGLALRGYTRSSFTWYVQSIYHIGIPFWKFKEFGTDDPIRNSQDEDIKGSVSGLDTTIGIAYLFGSR